MVRALEVSGGDCGLNPDNYILLASGNKNTVSNFLASATASVQRDTAAIQQNATSVGTSLKSRPSTTAAGTQANPSATQNIQVSPTLSRLTQTSLELSPDNQIKLVTTKQAPSQRKKVNHRQTSGKEKAKRKCRSPLAEAGNGKRAKRKGARGVVDLASPTIRDYFKTSDKSANQGITPLEKQNTHEGLIRLPYM